MTYKAWSNMLVVFPVTALLFRTRFFRTCFFHPCVVVLEYSVLVFSTRTHFAVLYFTFPYLHFPVLAISVPPKQVLVSRRTATRLRVLYCYV